MIGVTDMLMITVWKNPELSVEVPVRPDGKISVPLLDDIQAEGLTRWSSRRCSPASSPST